MKQVNLFKSLLFVGMLGASAVNGQMVTHPYAYGPYTLSGATTPTTSNWYKDYIGVRLEVTAPTPIVGSYLFTTSNDGSGLTGEWGGVVNTPLVNVPIFMPSPDSFSSNAVLFSSPESDSMVGKIAVIWRGPLTAAAVDFGCKALHAQQAGAVACVLINEYPGQAPVGMGASMSCTTPTITIPVFMIGNLDGIAISGQYRAGQHVTMTITPWGANLANDLGIIPSGGAFWHDFAMPANQINHSGNDVNLNQLDGAFIANFGTTTASNVKLTGNLSFTPTGGSATTIHRDSVVFGAASSPVYYHSSIFSDTARGANYPFAPHDSIIAMYAPSEYSIGTPPGTGRYDLTYNVSIPDIADDDPADNTLTYSFYATDSLYSKGRYDFTNNMPVHGTSEQFNTAGQEFVYGPMYYVGAKAGTSVENIQYFLAQAGTTPPSTVFLNNDLGGNLVFIYKWVDGSFGAAADSLIEDGELQLVSSSLYTFGVNPNDTSDALLEIKRSNGFGADPTAVHNYTGDASGFPSTVYLDPNSWYYIAVDVPSGPTTFLGIDDQLNPYPRTYGRAHMSNLMDYNSITNIDTTWSTNPGQINPPIPSGESNIVVNIDSFQLHRAKGLVPAVAMYVNHSADTVHVGVKNTFKSSIDMSVYPNPATEYLNVSVNLQQPAKSVTYEVMDGLGRFVGKVVHNNVQNEVYTLSTKNLAPGNYHMVVVANGQVQVRPFTVIR